MRTILLLLLFMISQNVSSAPPALLSSGILKVSGNVISLGCAIAPGSESLTVDFSQISTNDIYLNGKSKSIDFDISLINCAVNVFNDVSITFTGNENPSLPNHILVTPPSGIGIGVNDNSGALISLGVPYNSKISAENMILSFSAFIQGEEQAIEDKSIPLGIFSANLNFILEYL